MQMWWRASPERRNTTTVINAHAKQRRKGSLFQMSHQFTLQGVFIGGVTPPMYDYPFTPLQRSYSLNIPGHARDLPITVWVRYSSVKPTTLGGPLHPDRRRPRGLRTTRDADVAWSSPDFTFHPEEKRRLSTSALAPGVGFSALGVLSSPSYPKPSEDGHLRACYCYRLQSS